MVFIFIFGFIVRGLDLVVGNRDGLDICFVRICECLGFFILFFLFFMCLVNGELFVGVVDDFF